MLEMFIIGFVENQDVINTNDDTKTQIWMKYIIGEAHKHYSSIVEAKRNDHTFYKTKHILKVVFQVTVLAMHT